MKTIGRYSVLVLLCVCLSFETEARSNSREKQNKVKATIKEIPQQPRMKIGRDAHATKRLPMDGNRQHSAQNIGRIEGSIAERKGPPTCESSGAEGSCSN